jgi:hypothetical protein
MTVRTKLGQLFALHLLIPFRPIGQSARQDTRGVLRYRSPVRIWDEAMPVTNGLNPCVAEAFAQTRKLLLERGAIRFPKQPSRKLLV